MKTGKGAGTTSSYLMSSKSVEFVLETGQKQQKQVDQFHKRNSCIPVE